MRVIYFLVFLLMASPVKADGFIPFMADIYSITFLDLLIPTILIECFALVFLSEKFTGFKTGFFYALIVSIIVNLVSVVIGFGVSNFIPIPPRGMLLISLSLVLAYFLTSFIEFPVIERLIEVKTKKAAKNVLPLSLTVNVFSYIMLSAFIFYQYPIGDYIDPELSHKSYFSGFYKIMPLQAGCFYKNDTFTGIFKNTLNTSIEITDVTVTDVSYEEFKNVETGYFDNSTVNCKVKVQPESLQVEPGKNFKIQALCVNKSNNRTAYKEEITIYYETIYSVNDSGSQELIRTGRTSKGTISYYVE